MAGDSYIYPGGSYGLSPSYGDFIGVEERVPVPSIGIATDPRTANQLQAVSTALSTGAKTVEVSTIQPNVFEAIPAQHLEELNRLKKLVGAELTLHGPLVDPVGISKEGWSEAQREQAERQINNAVQMAHKIDPKGNIVVNFHTTAGLPEMEERVLVEKDGKKVEKVTSMLVVDERTGRIDQLKPKHSYFFDKEMDAENERISRNKEIWDESVLTLGHHARQGAEIVENAMIPKKIVQGFEPEEYKEALLDYYKESGTKEGEKILESAVPPEIRGNIKSDVRQIDHGKIYLKDAYIRLQNLFDQAYYAAEKKKDEESISKLKAYREEIKDKIGLIEKPEKIGEFSEVIEKGMKVLSNIKQPEIFKPMNEFAIEKAAETYGNVAFNAYKKFGDSSPIVVLENPPIGMGLARAEDMKKLIEKARDNFVEDARKKGISESTARRQAEKIIGATWDVGHINMLRKYGYGEKELVAETKKIAPFVKHVHLSDNFGMEHTELPMGMGNVPIGKELELIEGYNKQVKKIVEAGDWYQHFKTSPFAETLSAFGSPVYAMKMAPYWNQAISASGGYFAGYGMNPETHHAIYGAGFANLPVELGGQMAGRARMGGAPIE